MYYARILHAGRVFGRCPVFPVDNITRVRVPRCTCYLLLLFLLVVPVSLLLLSYRYCRAACLRVHAVRNSRRVLPRRRDFSFSGSPASSWTRTARARIRVTDRWYTTCTPPLRRARNLLIEFPSVTLQRRRERDDGVVGDGSPFFREKSYVQCRSQEDFNDFMLFCFLFIITISELYIYIY